MKDKADSEIMVLNSHVMSKSAQSQQFKDPALTDKQSIAACQMCLHSFIQVELGKFWAKSQSSEGTD